MEVPRLFVVKKDGRREQYSREKIIAGLRKACEKRPISESRMEAVAADLERELFARGESEVSSSLVGEKLMEALERSIPSPTSALPASTARSATSKVSAKSSLSSRQFCTRWNTCASRSSVCRRARDCRLPGT